MAGGSGCHCVVNNDFVQERASPFQELAAPERACYRKLPGISFNSIEMVTAMRMLTVAILAIAVVLPAAAQENDQAPPAQDTAMTEGSEMPDGWMLRFDEPDAKPDDVKFVTMGEGYHFTAGPAAIYYNEKYDAKGNYRVQGTFIQTKNTEHPEAYGLVFAGSDLQGPEQHYYYFLVRQNGEFMVKERSGDETSTLIEWSKHDVVQMANEKGQTTNRLAVEIEDENVQFLVNDIQVASLDRSKITEADGLAGVRINHNLDVHMDDFNVQPLTR